MTEDLAALLDKGRRSLAAAVAAAIEHARQVVDRF
jgi:hypothetical protein